MSQLSVLLIAAITLAACGPRSREPAPVIRVNSCAQDCEARRDLCFERCSENPDNELCDTLCAEELGACKQLCM